MIDTYTIFMCFNMVQYVVMAIFLARRFKYCSVYKEMKSKLFWIFVAGSAFGVSLMKVIGWS